MRRSTIGMTVAALTIAIGSSPAAAAAAPGAYSFADLGTLGGESSYAVAINDRGHVVGSSQVADGSWHGFLWRGGKMTDLGALRPYDINNRDDIIGATDASAYFLRAGRMTAFGAGVYPRAVNDRGQVVGMGAFGTTPFLWAAGRMTTLPLSYVSDINNRGQVSGGGSNAHASIAWRGRVTDLGAGSFDRSGSYRINAQGWVIGWQFSPVQDERGILWRNGTTTDVGTLGGDRTHLTAINDRGQILGSAQLPDGTMHPVLWRAGTMTDLTRLGVDPEHDLADLNNRGEIAASFRPVFGISHAAVYR